VADVIAQQHGGLLALVLVDETLTDRQGADNAYGDGVAAFANEVGGQCCGRQQG
jgi:hypothetical protein